ncbi:hypothetical protein WJ0W_004102 [Paenibacillus melissococcoides]|uniref:Uncharacterized protein n=1 Tax=Paenibacillus melissococcoides TaxID=2912268 RepID=A0ABN8U8Y7_9BACL|nr:hypothetical protein WJ0W_004102 [Paenibacillus melissococcoides]
MRIVGSHHHFRNAQGLLTTVKRENPVHPKAVGRCAYEVEQA